MKRIKKWNEDGVFCGSCVGHKNCSRWTAEIKAKYRHCGGHYYANEAQVKSLLENYKDIPRGSQEDLTFCCPECGCYQITREGELGEGYRVCKCCGQEWYIDVSYKASVQDTKDHDFRVRDPVHSLIHGDGEVYEIIDEKHSVVVCFPGRPDDGDSHEYFTEDGISEYGPFQCLYHGHDLEITVGEKPPVRTVERWLTVYMDKLSRETVAIVRDNGRDREPIESLWKIHGPVKVQIPE